MARPVWLGDAFCRWRRFAAKVVVVDDQTEAAPQLLVLGCRERERVEAARVGALAEERDRPLRVRKRAMAASVQPPPCTHAWTYAGSCLCDHADLLSVWSAYNHS